MTSTFTLGNIRRCLLAMAAAGSFMAGSLHAADAPRFDHVVRQQFFSGFSGNKDALRQGMQTCEQVLAGNPKHAEALVWHGSGLFFQAGQAMQNGNSGEGMMLSFRGIQEMGEAVRLEPHNLAVRVPRGSSLLAGARSMGANPMAKMLLADAISDYQEAYGQQAAMLDKLSTHQRGELLFGLADGHFRLGQKDEARVWFTRLRDAMPNTEYAKRAALWLETGDLPLQRTGCVGCHTASAGKQ